MKDLIKRLLREGFNVIYYDNLILSPVKDFKCLIEECDVIVVTHPIKIEFNTAWSMPEPILLEVSKQHPKLYFELRCYEESYAFWQISDIQKGKYVWGSSGEFKTCAEFNEFGLTHHNCDMCDEWLHEWCDNSDEQGVPMCDECKDKAQLQEAEIQELDQELWGEINA